MMTMMMMMELMTNRILRIWYVNAVVHENIKGILECLKGLKFGCLSSLNKLSCLKKSCAEQLLADHLAQHQHRHGITMIMRIALRFESTCIRFG